MCRAIPHLEAEPMRTPTLLFVTFLSVAACGDPDKPGTVASDMKQLGHDTKETAKDVGQKVGDSLSEAADSVEGWARTAGEKVSVGGDAFAHEVSSHMPDVEQAVDRAKLKLQAGGEEAKAAAQRLDVKLATLRSRLQDVSRDAAAATREMKDDVVRAYEDLAAELKSSVKSLG
jgi:ABC-type transporter Mla subunit MlaD